MIETIGPGRRTPGWAERGKAKENIPLPPGRRLRISDLPQQNRNLNAGLPRPGLLYEMILLVLIFKENFYERA